MRTPALRQQRKRLPKLLTRIVRQRQHHIAADILKPRLPRPRECAAAVPGSVPPAQPRKAFPARCLHAYRDPIHARRSVFRKQGGRQRFRVCLDRHFRARPRPDSAN